MSTDTTDPYQVYPSPVKGIMTRRVMEMVGVLHGRGYRGLRLASWWHNAGPAPVWFAFIAPGSFFSRKHGAILARNPMPEREEIVAQTGNPNDFPMFTSRRFRRFDSPFSDFIDASIDKNANDWIIQYPELAAAGKDDDAEYVTWYAEMLAATAPTGLIAADCYWEPRPEYMYISCGPPGVERFPLPPPGHDTGPIN